MQDMSDHNATKRPRVGQRERSFEHSRQQRPRKQRKQEPHQCCTGIRNKEFARHQRSLRIFVEPFGVPGPEKVSLRLWMLTWVKQARVFPVIALLHYAVGIVASMSCTARTEDQRKYRCWNWKRVHKGPKN
eukprot:2804451-Amphidinium_carterae.2